jgi:hypothetical protein
MEITFPQLIFTAAGNTLTAAAAANNNNNNTDTLNLHYL